MNLITTSEVVSRLKISRNSLFKMVRLKQIDPPYRLSERIVRWDYDVLMNQICLLTNRLNES